jgi:hypothetical protein
MDDTIEIPVTYKGEEYSFQAKVTGFGYTYRLEVQVGDSVVLLEPDEERNYRAVMDPSKEHSLSSNEMELVKEIIAVLESTK